MPIKILHKFQKEYGKVRGKKIFYAWENKRGLRNNRKSMVKLAKRLSK